jgi:hypothetical protein
MQPGERAAIYVLDPQYGFGDGGSFSFPAVPPKSQLVYDMTLLDWDAPTEVGQSRLAGSRVGVLGRHQGRQGGGAWAAPGAAGAGVCSQRWATRLQPGRLRTSGTSQLGPRMFPSSSSSSQLIACGSNKLWWSAFELSPSLCQL